MELNFSSVETVPRLNAAAAFQVDSGKVFKEDCDIVPTIIDDTLAYPNFNAEIFFQRFLWLFSVGVKW